eukprot:1095424_1
MHLTNWRQRNMMRAMGLLGIKHASTGTRFSEFELWNNAKVYVPQLPPALSKCLKLRSWSNFLPMLVLLDHVPEDMIRVVLRRANSRCWFRRANSRHWLYFRVLFVWKALKIYARAFAIHFIHLSKIHFVARMVKSDEDRETYCELWDC